MVTIPIHFKISDNNRVAPKTSGYTGYYIIVSFTFITPNGFTGSALKVDLDDNGKGVIHLPEPDLIEGEIINVEFYGLAGYWVAPRKTLTKTTFAKENDDKNPYEFGIDLVKNKELEKSYYTVKGRLVNIQTGEKVFRQQLFVFETETEEVLADNYKIVHALTTDLEGYFKFDMLWQEKEEKEENKIPDKFYHAYIPGSTEKLIPFVMKDGRIEERQILGIKPAPAKTAEPGKENDKDCSCATTPYLPDSEELARGEGVFSQDLGVGCVDFTKPNRVVEEHLYMQIVRTTDQQIKKVNIPTDTFQEILANLEKELEQTNTDIFIMDMVEPWKINPGLFSFTAEQK